MYLSYLDFPFLRCVRKLRMHRDFLPLNLPSFIFVLLIFSFGLILKGASHNYVRAQLLHGYQSMNGMYGEDGSESNEQTSNETSQHNFFE